MKRLSWNWVPVVLAVCLLGGCRSLDQGGDNDTKTPEKTQKLRVVTTMFPYYDFVRQIAGDRVELSLIIPAGMDSHSFEPTPAHMKTIGEADLIIWNGGEMEHWMEQVLEASDVSQKRVLTMMDYVSVVETEDVEGMEEGHSETHHHHGDQVEYDEHIWTSPVNAGILANVIGQTLAEEDGDWKEEYQEKTNAYVGQLKELDLEFLRLSEEKKRSTIVVGDQFPFRYLAEEYGFSYQAAFSGCSSDTEPSARTIAYLIDRIKEEGISVVYYLELGNKRVSQVIEEETKASPLLLHSCHNVTPEEFARGATYLELMRQNVINLRKGLVE